MQGYGEVVTRGINVVQWSEVIDRALWDICSNE